LLGSFSEVSFIGLVQFFLHLFNGILDLPQVVAYVPHAAAAIFFESSFVSLDEVNFLFDDVKGLLEAGFFGVEFEDPLAGLLNGLDTLVPVPGRGVEGFPSTKAAWKLSQVALEGFQAAHGHEPFFGNSAFFGSKGVAKGPVGRLGSAVDVGVDGKGFGGGSGDGGGRGSDGDVVDSGGGGGIFAVVVGSSRGLHLILRGGR
jgi:hypothetical protein